MSQEDKLTKPRWRVGDIIRHKVSAKPYRVIHIYKYLSTIIIDLTNTNALAQCLLLLPSHYDQYCIDKDMQLKGEEWKYSPVSL